MGRAKLHSWCSDASTFKPPFWAGVQTTNSPLPYSSWELFRVTQDCCRLRRNSVCTTLHMQRDKATTPPHALVCVGAWTREEKVLHQKPRDKRQMTTARPYFLLKMHLFIIYLSLSPASLFCSLLVKLFRFDYLCILEHCKKKKKRY